MRFHSPVLIVAGVITGAVVAVNSYASAARTVPSAPRVAAVSPHATPGAARVVWLPCPKGGTLKQGVCVLVEDRVVVRPAARAVTPRSAPATAEAPPSPAKATGPAAAPTSGPPTAHDPGSEDDHSDDQTDDHPDDETSEAPEPPEPTEPDD
jgi:hypothetical protein